MQVGQGQHQSQHSSYNNTPVPQVFILPRNTLIPNTHQEFGPDFSGVEGGELEMGSMEENKAENQQDNINNTNKRKDNDDLDLALDALRDCDTDFSKFVQVLSMIRMRFKYFYVVLFSGSGWHKWAIKFNNYQNCTSLGQISTHASL